MKEILITAVALLAIFGAPILTMWITVLIELLEKPRWTTKNPLNMTESAPCMVREMSPETRRERLIMAISEKRCNSVDL